MKSLARKALDPRTAVLLTCLMGLLVWKASFPGVLVHLTAALLPFLSPTLRERAEPGALRATCLFALFWAGLKCLVDALSLAFTLWPDFTGYLDLMAASACDALLLFVRLFSLMTAALALTLALSPGALARAAGWIIRPLAGKNAWKPALAFALMAQYLPRIHRMLRKIRTAALSRGLAAKGWAFWTMAFPNLFRILAQSTWNQAVAIAGRGIDCPEAWEENTPLSPHAIAAFILAALLLVIPVWPALSAWSALPSLPAPPTL